MERVADSTIRGFLYQFNVTLEQILKTPNGKIQIEGIVEDIDIIQGQNTTAIQCKYHESGGKFSLASIRKPILQMLKTECSKGYDSNISYVLYAYFQDLKSGIQHFTTEDLDNILKTTDENLIVSYIANIIEIDDSEINLLIKKKRKQKADKSRIKEFILEKNFDYELKFDPESFVSKFKFTIGKQLQNLQIELCKLLINSSSAFSKKDIIDIVYPNAIQMIADISTRRDDSRFISRDNLLKSLEQIKTTAITRWTRELISYKQLLKSMKNQLHMNLNKNHQNRLFILKASNFDDFDSQIVTFLKDFCELYCYKPQLHIPATFCILDYGKDEIDDIITRLYKFYIPVEDGFKGNEFFPESFFREPIFNHKENIMEFRLRLCTDNKNFIDALKRNKPEIIYSIVDVIPSDIETKDVRVESVDVKTIQDLEYVLNMKKGV